MSTLATYSELLVMIAERDAVIAELRSDMKQQESTAIADQETLRSQLREQTEKRIELQRELAELRKPAAVELTNLDREGIESHRETLLSQVLRQIREACPGWQYVDVDVRNDLIHQWRMRLNETAEDLARTVNAWQESQRALEVAMADTSRYRKELSAETVRANKFFADLNVAREAERRLREALTRIAAGGLFQPEMRDIARAALAQPQAEQKCSGDGCNGCAQCTDERIQGAEQKSKTLCPRCGCTVVRQNCSCP